MRKGITTVLGITLPLFSVGQALAQTATVTLSSQKQSIRGFGGMVHIPWAGDLTAAERTLAFGTADGQLGLTVLRIAVPDGNTSDSSYVATAKAAIAAGGIVYATPWNSSGSMSCLGLRDLCEPSEQLRLLYEGSRRRALRHWYPKRARLWVARRLEDLDRSSMPRLHAELR